MIIRISIIRTLNYLNAILNFKIPKDNSIFCKTKYTVINESDF